MARGKETWSSKTWRPWGALRNVGRPQMCWGDDLKRTVRLN